MSLSLALAIATIAAGCGGGSSSSSAGESSSSLTKEQFIAKASTICSADRGDIGKQFTTYIKQHQGQGSQEEVFAGMMKAILLPNIEEDIAKLRALEPPPGDKARIEAFLDAQQKAVDEMSNVKRLSEGPAGERYLEPASRLAKAYGIKSCAQS
jgi:hypothetical protein